MVRRSQVPADGPGSDTKEPDSGRNLTLSLEALPPNHFATSDMIPVDASGAVAVAVLRLLVTTIATTANPNRIRIMIVALRTYAPTRSMVAPEVLTTGVRPPDTRASSASTLPSVSFMGVTV